MNHRTLRAIIFWFVTCLVFMVVSTSQAGDLTPVAARNAAKPWLGIAIDKGPKGVLVKGIMADTPAEHAGFKVGDQVLSVDGKIVAEPQELIAVVAASGIGSEVVVVLLRDAKQVTKKLKLVMRPDDLKIVRDRLVGKPMPSFNLPIVGGKESYDSKKLTGRVAVIEFWATWCPACRASHPRLSEFAASHPEISVLAISDEDAADIQHYLNTTKPRFTVLHDIAQKSQAEYMASAIPMLVVVNKSGNVAFVTVGAGEAVEEALTLALKLSSK